MGAVMARVVECSLSIRDGHEVTVDVCVATVQAYEAIVHFAGGVLAESEQGEGSVGATIGLPVPVAADFDACTRDIDSVSGR
jgi:hypothetical protein